MPMTREGRVIRQDRKHYRWSTVKRRNQIGRRFKRMPQQGEAALLLARFVY